MKKRIITITLVLSLVLTCITGSVSAASIVPAPDSGSHNAYKKINGRYVVYNTSSDLTFYKQIMREYLEDCYVSSVGEVGDYCPAVWEAIQNVYNKELEHVNNAKSPDDLLEIIGFFVLPNSESMKAYEKLTVLGALDRDVVKLASNYRQLKEYLTVCIKDSMKYRVKSDYSDYYWSIIQHEYKSLLKKNKAVSGYEEFAAIMAEAINLGYFIEMEEESEIELESFSKVMKRINEDSAEEDDYIAEEDYGVFEIDYFDAYYEGQILTKYEVQQLKDDYCKFLDVYVDKQLAVSGYKGSISKVRKIAEEAKDRIAKMYDGAKIQNTALNAYDTMVEMTGIELEVMDEFKVSDLQDSITALYKKYKMTDYSESSWNLITQYYETAMSEVEFSCIYRAQLPVDIKTPLKKKFDSVPTYKKEIKSLKNKYTKSLKSFKGNKKYNQKEAVPVVEKGLNEIKAAESIEDVEKAYTSCYSKALKTIKKFKITTVKKGKGKITRDRTVKYGKNFTVKLTPDAGHKISKVYIDGKKKKLKNQYTFKSVKKSHKIKVVFE